MDLFAAFRQKNSDRVAPWRSDAARSLDDLSGSSISSARANFFVGCYQRPTASPRHFLRPVRGREKPRRRSSSRSTP